MTLRLPPHLDEMLTELAVRERMSQSELIREALRAYAAARQESEIRQLRAEVAQLRVELEQLRREIRRR